MQPLRADEGAGAAGDRLQQRHRRGVRRSGGGRTSRARAGAGARRRAASRGARRGRRSRCGRPSTARRSRARAASGRRRRWSRAGRCRCRSAAAPAGWRRSRCACELLDGGAEPGAHRVPAEPLQHVRPPRRAEALARAGLEQRLQAGGERAGAAVDEPAAGRRACAPPSGRRRRRKASACPRSRPRAAPARSSPCARPTPMRRPLPRLPAWPRRRGSRCASPSRAADTGPTRPAPGRGRRGGGGSRAIRSTRASTRLPSSTRPTDTT